MTVPNLDQRCITVKSWPTYFAAIAVGRKTFEVRVDDRDYREGDTVRLREWDPNVAEVHGDAAAYTGREITATIGYVLGVGGRQVAFALLDVGLRV